MKVIDLLNKIANDEEVPYKIRIKDREYFYDKYSNWYFFGKTSEDMFIDKGRLNEKVEIIEEDKKIEKLNYNNNDEFDIEGFTFDYEQKMQIVDKINEIINYINEGDK